MDRRVAAEIRRLHRLEKQALAHRERGRLTGSQAVMRRAITLELAVHERLNALGQRPTDALLAPARRLK